MLHTAQAQHKLGLGALNRFYDRYVLVVFLYGCASTSPILWDQNYVQRYHTLPAQKKPPNRYGFVCICIVPASLLFFIIVPVYIRITNQHADMLASR